MTDHVPHTDDGVTYCGWSTGHVVIEGCGELWPCSAVRALPAGEQHTGTLNLAGHGNPQEDDRNAEEHLQRSVGDAVYHHLVRALKPWQDHMAVEDINALTQGATEVALEAAAPAIRKQVAEEIAQAFEKSEFKYRGLSVAYAAAFARQIGGQR